MELAPLRYMVGKIDTDTLGLVFIFPIRLVLFDFDLFPLCMNVHMSWSEDSLQELVHSSNYCEPWGLNSNTQPDGKYLYALSHLKP